MKLEKTSKSANLRACQRANLPTCQPANLKIDAGTWGHGDAETERFSSFAVNSSSWKSNLKAATQTNLARLLGSTLVALVGLMGTANSIVAQPTLSPCQPPQPDEYILLVLSPTQESQGQLQQILPTGIESTVCQYLDDTVTRIAGFGQLEDANAWVRYVNEAVGLSAFVVRSAPTTSPPPSTGYNPQPLGNGYAVLVDYFNQPEVASQLKQILGGDVGLVSYGQRPYLLAAYTTDESTANSTLRQLTNRGFWSMIVDSRRVTLLSPDVNF